MAASPSERPDPAEWFLQAPGGKFTIRITAGLVIGEDDRGHFDIGSDAAFPLVRFEIEAGAPCIQVIAPDWVLATPERTAGDRHRVRRTTELSLPNNLFRIVGAGRADGKPERIELIHAPSEVRHPAGSSEAAAATGMTGPVASAAPTDDDITEPMLADDAPGVRSKRAGLDAPGAAAPPAGRAALFSSMPEPDRAPDPNPRHVPPARPAASPGLFAVPERPRRSRNRSRNRSRRRSGSGSHWAVTLLTIAVYLGGLMFSTPVQSPVPGQDASGAAAPAATPAAMPAAAADDGLLASVEQLLRKQSPPDRSTLDFAVKAYRAAHSRRPDDDRLRRRLAELESVRPNVD